MDSFDTSSFDACIKKIEKIGNDFPKKGVRQALRAAAKVLQRSMLSLVPVASGDLKRSIKIKSGRRKKNYIGMLIGVMGEFYKGDQFYGGFVEYGHMQGRRGAKNRKHVEGEHFAEYAVEESGTSILSTLIEGLQKAIKEYEI